MTDGVPAVHAPHPPDRAAGVPGQDWDAADRVLSELSRDAQVLLLCHVNPDGDAVGSMLGFGLGLRRLGFGRLQASFSGLFELPQTLTGLPGRELLVHPSAAGRSPRAVFAFDVASVERLGDFAETFHAAPVSVVLDHHASNTRFGRVNLVDPGAAATAVVVEDLLGRLGVPLDDEIAECLYVALATDTGSFRFGCTPEVHQLAARLIATGIQPAVISRRLFDSRPFGAIRLFGDVLARTRLELAAAAGHSLVWTFATLADLRTHGQRPYVLEPLIDSVRCAQEADVACVLKEVADREWSVSLRSKGSVDVSRLAVLLGGGGHRSAAGFIGRGTVDEVIESVRRGLSRGAAGPASGGSELAPASDLRVLPN